MRQAGRLINKEADFAYVSEKLPRPEPFSHASGRNTWRVLSIWYTDSKSFLATATLAAPPPFLLATDHQKLFKELEGQAAFCAASTIIQRR